MLAAPHAKLKAKMTQKAATRPEDVVFDRLPAGGGQVSKVPQRHDAEFSNLEKAAGDAAFKEKVEKVAKVFRRCQRGRSTSKEHESYVLIFNDWLVKSGHGSFFKEVPGVKRGEESVVLETDESDAVKVIEPHLLSAWLLEMLANSELTPKGGLRVRESSKPQLCGSRSSWKKSQGKFGGGKNADEPWSMQVSVCV